ncbi:hypothetical protein B0H19DRAFT_1242457 [Mycena capillaripes]|nr:hypothetical protein B0H19DRAFT_1242457 [Mycena capillaripes]
MPGGEGGVEQTPRVPHMGISIRVCDATGMGAVYWRAERAGSSVSVGDRSSLGGGASSSHEHEGDRQGAALLLERERWMDKTANKRRRRERTGGKKKELVGRERDGYEVDSNAARARDESVYDGIRSRIMIPAGGKRGRRRKEHETQYGAGEKHAEGDGRKAGL